MRVCESMSVRAWPFALKRDGLEACVDAYRVAHPVVCWQHAECLRPVDDAQTSCNWWNSRTTGKNMEKTGTWQDAQHFKPIVPKPQRRQSSLAQGTPLGAALNHTDEEPGQRLRPEGPEGVQNGADAMIQRHACWIRTLTVSTPSRLWPAWLRTSGAPVNCESTFLTLSPGPRGAFSMKAYFWQNFALKCAGTQAC